MASAMRTTVGRAALPHPGAAKAAGPRRSRHLAVEVREVSQKPLRAGSKLNVRKEQDVAHLSRFTASIPALLFPAMAKADELPEAAQDVLDSATDFAESALDSAAELAGGTAEFVGGLLEGASGLTDSAGDWAADVAGFVGANPEVAVIGSAAVILPGIVAAVLGKGYAGDIGAEDAYNTIMDSKESVLLDIRDKQAISELGSPKLPGKKLVAVPFEVMDDDVLVEVEDFSSKVSNLKRLEDTSTPIYVIDRFGKSSVKAAKLLTKEGFQTVYSVVDGVEGPRGWKTQGLAWKEPFQPFKLDLAGVREVLSSAAAIAEKPNVVPSTLGAAAAAGLGFLAFSEVETVLQVLGSAALIQVFVSKLLYAKDRERTLAELSTFFDTKVAPASLVDEIKEIGSVLTSAADDMTKSNGAASSVSASAAASENGATAQTSSTDLPKSPTPLSPYVAYPDLKPPTSPTPSKP